MPSARRTLPRALRSPAVLVALALLAVVALGACSSSGSGSTTSSSEAVSSAAVIAKTFNIPDDARSCLEEKLAGNGKARDALTTTTELSSSQLDAVAQVLEACVTVDQWAQALAGRITAAVPPADQSKLTTQLNCLTNAVTGLDQDQRRALLVGLVVVGTAPQTGPLAIKRGDILNGLYSACSVTVRSSSSSTTSPAAAATPTSRATAGG